MLALFELRLGPDSGRRLFLSLPLNANALIVFLFVSKSSTVAGIRFAGITVFADFQKISQKFKRKQRSKRMEGNQGWSV